MYLNIKMANKFGGKISVVDILMFIWWGYVLLRTYFLPSAPCYGEILTYSSLFTLYVVVRLIDGYFSIHSNIYTWGILGYAGYQLFLGYYQLYSGTSHHYLYPVTGTFNNPGPYSAGIAMGVVMALANLKLIQDKSDALTEKTEKAICWGMIIFGSLMLAITFSRSAFVVVSMMFLYTYRKYLWRYRGALAFSVVVFAAILLYLKWGSTVGRIIIWWQALAIWAEHPVLGVGIGGFAGEYGNQLYHFFSDANHIALFANYADVTEFAFCDSLQIAAEQGIVGAAFCYAIIRLAIKGLYEKSPTLLYGWVALLIFSLFSFPFQLLPYRMLGVFFITKGASGKKLFSASPWLVCTIGGLAMALSFGCWKFGTPYIKAHEENKMWAGVPHSTFIPDDYRLLPYCNDDKNFLFSFAKLLQANKRYMDSNAILRQGIKISNDPIFWVLMGNNYRQMSLYDDAIKCYDIAFHRLPNRLYPLYQKMITLKEKGDKVSMKRVARQILEFHPKIPSPAVEEMKKMAHEAAF